MSDSTTQKYLSKLEEMINPEETSFNFLYNLQIRNQKKIIEKGLYDVPQSELTNLPTDNPKLMSYHIKHLMSEIGEILDADKRWKSFRNGKFDDEEKIKEIADCFIVLMNIAIYSGYNSDAIVKAIISKIEETEKRIS